MQGCYNSGLPGSDTSSEFIVGTTLAAALMAAHYPGDSGEDVDRLITELAKRGATLHVNDGSWSHRPSNDGTGRCPICGRAVHFVPINWRVPLGSIANDARSPGWYRHNPRQAGPQSRGGSTMSELTIGHWVRRTARAYGHGRWHRIESVIADDAVTSCGRRLRNETGPLETSEAMPLTRAIGQQQNCRQCDRG